MFWRMQPRHVVVYLASLAAALGMIIPAQATAQDIAAARELVEQREFLEGAELAEGLGTPAGLALAADTLGFYGYYLAPEEEKQALFERGWNLAEKAIELDPTFSEAHLQHSHTMGRYAQTIGVLEALNEGFAERIREAIDKSLELDPAKAGAYVSLGAWHAEIVASAGFMAGMLYGADEEQALENYRKALELAPDDATVHLEYGIGLLKLDENDNAALAKEHFQKAMDLAADHAVGQVIRAQAEERLTDLGD